MRMVRVSKSGLFLEQSLSGGFQVILGFSACSTSSAGWLEKIAKIGAFLFDNPISRGFTTFIVVCTVVKIAVLAGMGIPAAMGAGVLPVVVVCLDVLSARPAGSHGSLQWHHTQGCLAGFFNGHEHGPG
jgi:hypothetical protein